MSINVSYYYIYDNLKRKGYSDKIIYKVFKLLAIKGYKLYDGILEVPDLLLLEEEIDNIIQYY